MPLSNFAADVDASPRVMVTGANGFIGARVVRDLERAGVIVIAVVRPGSHKNHQARLVSSHQREPMTVECDLHNNAAVTTLIARHRPQSCIHSAWDVAGSNYLHDATNQRWVHASLHLARCLIDNGCRWLGVCGTHIEPIGAIPPPNRYAAAKVTLRHRLFELAPNHFTVCWWKIFQPYGEGERSDRFMPSTLTTLAAGKRFLVRHPEAMRDFIHADDVASAIVASQRREIGGVFDVGSGQSRRLRDVAQLAARMLGAGHLLDFADSPPSIEHSTPADPSSLQGLADWQPQVKLESGLRALAHALNPPLRATA